MADLWTDENRLSWWVAVVGGGILILLATAAGVVDGLFTAYFSTPPR
ncbi:MAG: hypothetical protein ACREI3_09265 [Nitrospirales bacterium]